MRAEPLLNERVVISSAAFAELVVWRVPIPLAGSTHDFKYRLAFVVEGICVLRYDNEAGKGDHIHRAATESPYFFTSPRRLLEDFWRDVDLWRRS